MSLNGATDHHHNDKQGTLALALACLLHLRRHKQHVREIMQMSEREGAFMHAIDADRTTLQDLGIQLGRHVFTLNCNEGMNHRRTGKVLMGAVQAGAWTLYDNVNCLQADVMSVFASQIGPILQVKLSILTFMGRMPDSHSL